MSQGYDQFFRKARQASTQPKTTPRSAKPSQAARPRFDLPTEKSIEANLRQRANMKPKRKRRSFPWGLAFISAIGAAGAAWALLHAEQVEKVAKAIEISWFDTASASEAAPAKAPAKGDGSAAAGKPAAEGAEKGKAEAPAAKELSATDLDHLSKLTERSKELDAREQEITRQEGELAKMKVDLESRLKELEQMRAKISEMLAERVKVDDTKLETLVQTYSNMKAPQAAKVLESMDEDLAVEILSRMKKKNAADIMNLLKPDKAQVFSEKYAGYKRK